MRVLSATRNVKRGTSWLAVEVEPEQPLVTQEWILRGGICWPIVVDESAQGYAILLGQRVDEQDCVLLSETQFATILPVVAGGQVVHTGLAWWLNDAFARFGARNFYATQGLSVSQLYRTMIHDADAVQPKPYLYDVLVDPSALKVMLAFARDHEIVALPQGSVVLDQLERMQAEPAATVDLYPAAIALGSALYAVLHRPWRGAGEAFDSELDPTR